MKTETFTCAACHERFDSTWTDEEAAAEGLERFGADLFVEGAALVCDDCYRRLGFA